jgi:hypothetical protein
MLAWEGAAFFLEGGMEWIKSVLVAALPERVWVGEKRKDDAWPFGWKKKGWKRILSFGS